MNRENASNISRVRRTLWYVTGAVGAMALIFFIFAVRPADLSAGGNRIVIRIWYERGGRELVAYERSVRLFEQTHPQIACQMLYVPNDLSNSQKFYTAVIGNCAPEVIFVDGPQVAEWAERGLLTPLNELLKEYLQDRGLSLDEFEQQFFTPCWRQCVYRDRIWAITFLADPNFCFFWNKDVMRKAIADGEIPPGLIDPEVPPATLADLDCYNKALTKLDSKGRLVRAGLVPWGVYGGANSIFSWGWAFGGSFYDYEKQKITANHPRVVAALEWMSSYARKYDYRRIAALESSFGVTAQDPFIASRQVMRLYHLQGLADLDRYASELDYGIAPIPQPAGGEANSSWVGGWTMAIPSTVTDPAKRQAALEYILWACASEEGTSMAVRTKRHFPGWKVSSFYEDAVKDPRLAQYVNILRQCKHQRPVMPAQAFFMNELDRAVGRAVRGEMSPAEALEQATMRTQARLDKILSKRSHQQ